MRSDVRSAINGATESLTHLSVGLCVSVGNECVYVAYLKMSEIANIGLHAFDVAKQFYKVQKLQYQSACACVVRVESTC